MAEGLAEGGKVEAALDVVEGINLNERPRAIQALLNIIGQEQHLNPTVLTRIQTRALSQRSWKPEELSKLAQLLAREKLSVLAEAMINSIEDSFYREEAKCRTAVELVRLGELDRAKFIANESSSPQTSGPVRNIFAKIVNE
jgi:hypothetical protein